MGKTWANRLAIDGSVQTGESPPLTAGQQVGASRDRGDALRACTSPVRIELSEVKGVVGGQVDYEEARATDAFVPPVRPTPAKLIRAVERAGYRARIEAPRHREGDGAAAK